MCEEGWEALSRRSLLSLCVRTEVRIRNPRSPKGIANAKLGSVCRGKGQTTNQRRADCHGLELELYVSELVDRVEGC